MKTGKILQFIEAYNVNEVTALLSGLQEDYTKVSQWLYDPEWDKFCQNIFKWLKTLVATKYLVFITWLICGSGYIDEKGWPLIPLNLCLVVYFCSKKETCSYVCPLWSFQTFWMDLTAAQAQAASHSYSVTWVIVEIAQQMFIADL